MTERAPKLGQRLGLNLTDALTREAERVAHLLKGVLVPLLDAKAQA